MSWRKPYLDHDPGDEDSHVEFLRWMAGDMIGTLCHLVKEAGLTMTLHGKPVSGPDELREAAYDAMIDRIAPHLVEKTETL